MADAASLFDLAARISVDSRGVEQNLTSTQKKVLQLAEEFKKVDRSAQVSANNTANALKKTEASAKTAFTNVSRAGTGASQDISQAVSTLSPRLASLAGTAGPLGLVAVALVGIGAATAGLVKLVVSSAEATGKLHDLAQQTDFSVETLSALGNAAETSGGSLDTITNALFIFETKMGEAKDTTSQMGRVFKALEIDTTNNEKALRQSISALLAMTNAEDRARVGKQLFGRSVKDLLGAIKEAGSLDAFMNKQLRDGTLITTEAAKRGDDLTDSITKLGQKFNAVGRQVADEFAPMVTDALRQFSKWLNDNQKELIATAREVARLIKDISNLASFIYSISPIKLQVEIVRTIKTIVADIFPGEKGQGPPAGKSIFDRFREFVERGPEPRGSQGALVPVDTTGQPNQTAAQIAATRKANLDAAKKEAAEQKKLQDALNALNRAGAGGGGGRTQRDVLEGLKTSLIGLNAEFRKFNIELLDSANLTAEAAEKEKLLANLMSSLSVKTRMAISELTNVDDAINEAIGNLPKKSQEAARALVNQSLAQFELNENTRISGELNKEAGELAKQWAREIQNTVSGADEYTIAIQALERSYAKYGKTLDEGTRKELEHQASVKRTLAILGTATSQIDAMIRMYESLDRAMEAARPIDKDLEALANIGEPPEVSETFMKLIEARERFRNEMQNLAYDLTSVLDRAIYDGFSQGAKRGLASLAMGLLDIIRNVFLKQLEVGLTEVLTKALGGAQGTGGGGNFFSKLFNFGLSAIGGLFGGGKTTLPINPNAGSYWMGFRAEGGPVTAGLPYKVHRDEVIIPTSDGMVYNKAQQGMGMTVINNWSISAYGDSAQALLSRQTQSQIERRSARSVQRGAIRARAA